MQGENFEDFKRKMAGVNGGAPDEEDLGPCASRPSNKWITCVHVHDGAKPVDSFQYAHMAVHGVFEPTKFTVIFAAHETWKLTVEGRNLWTVYNLICQHRLEWIRKVDRDIGADDKKAVITGIKVEDVTPAE